MVSLKQPGLKLTRRIKFASDYFLHGFTIQSSDAKRYFLDERLNLLRHFTNT